MNQNDKLQDVIDNIQNTSTTTFKATLVKLLWMLFEIARDPFTLFENMKTYSALLISTACMFHVKEMLGFTYSRLDGNISNRVAPSFVKKFINLVNKVLSPPTIQWALSLTAGYTGTLILSRPTKHFFDLVTSSADMSTFDFYKCTSTALLSAYIIYFGYVYPLQNERIVMSTYNDIAASLDNEYAKFIDKRGGSFTSKNLFDDEKWLPTIDKILGLDRREDAPFVRNSKKKFKVLIITLINWLAKLPSRYTAEITVTSDDLDAEAIEQTRVTSVKIAEGFGTMFQRYYIKVFKSGPLVATKDAYLPFWSRRVGIESKETNDVNMAMNDADDIADQVRLGQLSPKVALETIDKVLFPVNTGKSVEQTLEPDDVLSRLPDKSRVVTMFSKFAQHVNLIISSLIALWIGPKLAIQNQSVELCALVTLVITSIFVSYGTYVMRNKVLEDQVENSETGVRYCKTYMAFLKATLEYIYAKTTGKDTTIAEHKLDVISLDSDDLGQILIKVKNNIIRSRQIDWTFIMDQTSIAYRIVFKHARRDRNLVDLLNLYATYFDNSMQQLELLNKIKLAF